MNVIGHNPHGYGFSPVWIALYRKKTIDCHHYLMGQLAGNKIHLMWAVSVLACLKLFSQISHTNSFLSSCTRWWDRKFPPQLKLFSHFEQRKGLVPVWTRLWISRFDELLYLWKMQIVTAWFDWSRLLINEFYLFGHMVHSNFFGRFLPECMSKWKRRLSFLANPLLQMSHSKNFSLKWYAMCCFNSDWSESWFPLYFPRIISFYNQSLNFRCDLLLNSFRQLLHRHIPFLGWIDECNSRSSVKMNVFRHFAHLCPFFVASCEYAGLVRAKAPYCFFPRHSEGMRCCATDALKLISKIWLLQKETYNSSYFSF